MAGFAAGGGFGRGLAGCGLAPGRWPGPASGRQRRAGSRTSRQPTRCQRRPRLRVVRREPIRVCILVSFPLTPPAACRRITTVAVLAGQHPLLQGAAPHEALPDAVGAGRVEPDVAGCVNLAGGAIPAHHLRGDRAAVVQPTGQAGSRGGGARRSGIPPAGPGPASPAFQPRTAAR